MENNLKGIAWFGDIYTKFEAVCLEVEDVVWQEGFKYFEDRMQTVGVNVKQFCSEFVQEVLSHSPVEETAACDSSLAQSCDEVDQLSNEAIVGNFSEKDSSKESCFVLECSPKPVKDSQHDLSLQDCVEALMPKNLEMEMKERSSQVKNLDLEILDKSTMEDDDPSFPLLSPTFEDVRKSKAALLDASSNSTDLVDTCHCESLDVKLPHLDSLTNKIRQNLPMEVYTLPESACKENLDESCILLDRSEFGEFSSACIEARRSKFFKRRVQAPFISKGKSVNPGWHSELNPRRGQDKVVGPVYGSPIVISSNQEEIIESDWEII